MGLNTTKIIDTIPAPLHPATPEKFPIENVKYVASYSGIEAENPTIIVPGASYRFFLLIFVTDSRRFPDLWEVRTISFALHPGDTFVYVDWYSAQIVAMPLLAAADETYSQEAAPPVH